MIGAGPGRVVGPVASGSSRSQWWVARHGLVGVGGKTPGLRSGDGMRSVRARPCSLNRDRRRSTTGTSQSACLVNVHAKPPLIREPLPALRAEAKGPGPSHLPGQTRAIPRTAQAVTGNLHDPENTRDDLDHPGDERSSPGRQITQIRQPAQAASGTISAAAPNIQVCAGKLPNGIQPNIRAYRRVGARYVRRFPGQREIRARPHRGR